MAVCDGSDATIFAALTCTVPIATLAAAPYSLVYQDSVKVKVIATNVKGSSIEGLEGNGALIIQAPDAPVNLREDQ